MEPKRFRISQDGNEYAMAIKLLGERVKLECVDSSVPGAPIYCRTYTVDELASESRFFQMVPRSNEAQIELMNVVMSEKVRLYNRGDYMEVTINPNLGQSIQQSVVYDPTTGTSRIQTSVVNTPGTKRSLYDEIRMRPGFGTPFVDSYGDEGFFDSGLPSKLGSTIGNSNIGLTNSGIGGATLANSGYGINPNL